MADAVQTVEAASDRGIATYYQSKLDGLNLTLRERQKNLRRLEAQRNELNSTGACACACCLFPHTPLAMLADLCPFCQCAC